MTDEDNFEILRRAYGLFNRWAARPRDAPLLAGEAEDFLHPEVAFHTYASSPEAGIYRGPGAVLEYNQRLFEQFESVRIELDELVAVDDRVVVISRQHAVPRGGHAPMVVPVVELWAIRDGLLAERHPFSTRAEALEAAGVRE